MAKSSTKRLTDGAGEAGGRVFEKARYQAAAYRSVTGQQKQASAVPKPSGPCGSCAQRTVCLPKGLARAELEALENLVLGARTVQAGGYLYHAGDRQRSFLAVRSGLVKVVSTSARGDEQVTGFRLPGELLGLESLASERSANSALAIETSSVCRIPVAPLLKLSRKSARMQHQLYRLVSGQLANRNLELTILGKHKADAGLAALLVNLAERYQARGYSGVDFNLSMSRAEIGSYLGITLETVSRLFSRLQKDGLLQVDKRRITILEPDRLRRMAGYPFTVDPIRV